MTRWYYIFFAVLALVSVSCSGSDSFKIKGEIAGGANTNLYIKYYGNDALQTLVTAAREGVFEAKGSAYDPTIIEIVDNENRVLGMAYVVNGDEINININLSDPTKNTVTGNEINERWSKLINSHALTISKGTAEEINQLISDYITEHPDDIVGGLMMATYYDASINPAEAADLLDKLAPEAQIPTVIGQLSMQLQRYASASALGHVGNIRYRTSKNDSVMVFKPTAKAASLIVFSDDQSNRNDSIVPEIRRINREYPSSKLQIMDIVLLNDTNSWKHNISRDSATWIQGWMPGGMLSRDLDSIAVPSVPFYIVTDTAGAQLYRGRSVKAAEKIIKTLTK